VDRDAALLRLNEQHRALLDAAGCVGQSLKTVRQVHGARVVVVHDAMENTAHLSADGLCTNCPGVVLGIYVADCAPVFLHDPVHKAIALLHSGKKGSALGIVKCAVRLMSLAFESAPSDLRLLVGPCIRPPHYEIDFAKQILADAHAAGLRDCEDCGDCTGADLKRYYSYRMEQGRTGRMLAFLALP